MLALLNLDECFSKGGIGIISPGTYALTHSNYNELRITGGVEWRGKPYTDDQTVLIWRNTVIDPLKPPSGFTIRECAIQGCVIVSFHKERINFIDQASGTRGFYRRLIDEDSNSLYPYGEPK